MWRRWGHSRDPAIGYPTLVDTTVDEGYLETIPEVDSVRSGRSSIQTTSLPDLPLSKCVAPLQPSDYANDIDRTSSVYSQPSPIISEDNAAFPPERSTSVRSEVSPLNTPHSSYIDLNRPISPINSANDGVPQYPKAEARFKSQIPRKIVPIKSTIPVESAVSREGTQPTATSDEETRQETRWDDYSGEPSDTGKPSVVRPGAQPLEFQYPQLKERTRQILAGLRERDPSKKYGVGNMPPSDTTDPLDNPVQREPWKGASGRTILVEPVRNNPGARLEPLKVPERKAIPAASKQDPITSQFPAMPSPALPSPELPSPALPTPTTIRAAASQESIKPVVPLKLGANSPNARSPINEDNTATLRSPFQTPQFPVDQSIHEAVTLSALDDLAGNRSSDEILTPVTPTPQRIAEHRYELNPGQEVSTAGIPNEPNSRFNWTTYSTTVDDSPRSTADTAMNESPVPPAHMMPSPIIVRKRPIASALSAPPFYNIDAAASNSSVVTRKPISADRNRTASLITTASMSKSLPQCPPELEAMDKISTLEWRMDDLSRRKRNINKLIRDLTDGMRRNSIAYEARKRKEVEKMLTNFNLELAEINQEEHDVGIQLHRAQRKRDKADSYEQPTGLWIRRITTS